MSETNLLKHALVKAFEEVDKTNTGYIYGKDIETVLTFFNKYPEVTKKLDKTVIKNEISHFYTGPVDKDKLISKDEFINYYLTRLPHWI